MTYIGMVSKDPSKYHSNLMVSSKPWNKVAIFFHLPNSS